MSLVSWRFGGWQYGGMGESAMWPGGALGCRDLCEGKPACMHWVFDCNTLHCHIYGIGGYEEDGDGQFGRDYQFLSDSSRFAAENARRMAVKAAGRNPDAEL